VTPATLHYILATAGHVDHGKSALVLALTGTDPDRLPQEKARGITIDLGFAWFDLPAPAARYRVGVIDVPGHEDFVKNMVAGVGSVDAALLVVAADDGWMPQTQEHVEILTYLGVRRGVVALSKADRISDCSVVITAIASRLRGTALDAAPIIPTSVVDGRGIEALKAALADVLAKTPPREDVGKPRLPVDRAFSLKGVGTIVTGTLTGGSLRRGQSVIVQPGGSSCRVRSLQTYHRDVEVALPGTRVALNLPDFQPADGRASRTATSVGRGDVVTIEGVGRAGAILDVMPQRSPAGLLQDGASVWLHHGSGAVKARVRLLEKEGMGLDCAQSGRTPTPTLPLSAQGGSKRAGSPQTGVASETESLARLTLSHPVLALAGDRMIVRDGSERRTLAGAIVLDAAPPRVTRRAGGREAQRGLLQARARAPFDPMVFVATLLMRDCVVLLDDLGRHCAFGAAALADAVIALTKSGMAITAGPFLADANWWTQALAQIGQAVDVFHQQHPQRPGLALPEARQLIARALPRHVALDAMMLLEAMTPPLSRDGIEQSAGALRRRTHRLSLPPRLEEAGRLVRQKLVAHRFDPPSLKELATTDAARQAVKFLIISGEAVEIGGDIVFSSEAYAGAVQTVRGHIQTHGPSTVSELKQVLASSRRVVVPLLEKLDREGVTRRQGDLRVLR
jgi:selenocysteine-specific elongation factor